jgi:tetratricopeptide (TPR) repeat protein
MEQTERHEEPAHQTDLPETAGPRAQSPVGPEPASAVPADGVPALADPGSSAPAARAGADLDTEDDRRIAAELSRRGVPPEEIERLLAMGRARPADAGPRDVPTAPETPWPPPSSTFVPVPTIALPDFRESSPAERAEADRLLTAANVARRRGAFADAEQASRRAVELVPKDPGALELYGDVLQGVGRVDDAVIAYQRAHEADPKRRSAERKYAALTLMQHREIAALRDEYIPRNPFVATLLSALLPGAGQLYNGEPAKGLTVTLVTLVCVLVLGWSSVGFVSTRHGISAAFALFMVAAGLTYIYGVVDASRTAQRGRRKKSGWEV